MIKISKKLTKIWVVILILQGDCLMGLFKFDEAIEYYDQAIQLDKGDKDVYFCKGKED